MQLAFPIGSRAVGTVRLGAITTDGTTWPELVGFLLLLGPRPPTFTRGTAGEQRHLVRYVPDWNPAVPNTRIKGTRWTLICL